MPRAERRAPERRASREGERPNYTGDMGGNGDTATSQSGGQGSCGGRVPLNRSLLMLSRLVWQLASVFVAQLDQEVALYRHNSGYKSTEN